MPEYSLEVDYSGTLRDSHNRAILLRGINLDGGGKAPIQFPSTFEQATDEFYDADNVSFVNRPFTLEDAPVHLQRIKNFGFNTIRYLFTWEALEHAGPGKYDNDFIDFSIKLLNLIDSYGFYVFLDPHQDTWSRFSGGSGAPLWTLYAMGLNPRAFKQTEAALVQPLYDKPATFPKMIWPTNYNRLACQVAFTLFTAGTQFAPKAIIDGVNIQEYLQDKMLAALSYFYRRIFNETDLANRTIIGVESFNELNHGLVGYEDIEKLPQDNSGLKLGTTPTPFQAMLLGVGIKQEVDVYEFKSLGPTKTGTTVVDPKGVSVWLPPDYDDTKYGWHRDPGWKLGRCIWAQHGVWDDKTNTVLKPYYFKYTDQGQPIDLELFNNTYFMSFWNKYYMGMREIDRKMFLLCQPPVMTIPPNLHESAFMDQRVIYSPHYYDGLTLINKHWSKWWNVDVLGVLRGRYSSPAFAIKIGETAIRNCLRDQLTEMKKEGLAHIGRVPCLMSETGMPFDLNNKEAYNSGDYTSQIDSWDALGYALEGSQIHHTLWTYCANNSHKHGDFWNGEDFSIYCKGGNYDLDMPADYGAYPMSNSSTMSVDSSSQLTLESVGTKELAKWGLTHGSRAEPALARPFPLAIVGSLVSYGFDLKKAVFSLTINAESSIDGEVGTLVVLPEYNFPIEEDLNIELTSGSWEFDSETRILTWWHESGEQSLTVKSLTKRNDSNSWFWNLMNVCC